MDDRLSKVNNCVYGSSDGVFARIDREVVYLTESNNCLIIERSFEQTEAGILGKARLENISGKEIEILSVVVSDFYLPKEMFPDQVLDHSWSQSDETKFKKLEHATVKNKIFFKTDQNPFSFREEYGYLKGSVLGEWFTILRFGEYSLVIGAATTADLFSQVFLRKERDLVHIRVTCQFDGIILNPGKSFSSEKIAFLFGPEQEILNKFADLIRENMNLDKTFEPITGVCCPYYWKGNLITEDVVEKELNSLKWIDGNGKIDFLQIDAGYSRSFGDWFDYDLRFPKGLTYVSQLIEGKGYRSGIWIAPFIANPTSKIFKDHEDWFLRDDDGRLFESSFLTPFQRMVPALRFRALDTTNDGFLEYLKAVILSFKEAGFKLFKLDFMYPVCLSANYSKRITRAQALRKGVKFIRDLLGPDIHLLVGISVFSPLVGLVDSTRMGIDALDPYSCRFPVIRSLINNYMLKSNLRSCRIHMFMNGKIWSVDPDCINVRKGTGIRKNLVEEHIRLAKENNLCLWFGDKLSGMSGNTKKIFTDFFHE